MALNQFPRRSFVGSSTLQTFTGDGTTTAFTLSSTQTQNELFVFVDDVTQVPGVDFTVSGTTLTFTSAPANNAEIIARGFGVPAPVTTVSDGSVTAAKLATGAIEAKLGYTPVSPTQLSTEVNNLIAGAPGALNTLDELAAALGDDANYAATITNALAAKANSSDVNTALALKANTSSLGTLATVSPTGTADNTKFLRGDNSWQVVSVTPTAVSDQVNTSTGAFDLPSGTTAQRPSSPSVGMIRFNTDRNDLETWNGTTWVKPSEFIATGGTITNSGGYKIHTFTSSGTLQVTGGSTNAQLLVVAGGGGGGWDVGGGGGAGGYISQSTVPLSVGSYTIIVGGGGGRGSSGGTAPSGGNSSAIGYTAIGGGGGGNYSGGNGGAGGSGGGGAGYGASTTGGSGTSGQGFAGGNGLSGPGNNASGGGGGGAAGIGSNSMDFGSSRIGLAPGGAGVANSISGSSVTYATGGGGGADFGPDSFDAAANTGNGGNGAGQSGALGNSGGAGGSGIVIIRYIA